MNKKGILKDLEENIYCRIARSPIHGVGVFAIKKIPKGTNPFKTYIPVDAVAIPEKEIMKNKKIPKAVKEMVKAFYAIQDGKIYCDARSLNEINISYFLNHSEKPNMDATEINEESIFTANRRIQVGEELFANYSEYSDSYPESEL
jgi:SET domain-containing protein